MRYFPVLLLGGCMAPDFSQEWMVDRTRILALRTDPAETRPGDGVTVTGLLADPDGTPTALWYGCNFGDACPNRAALEPMLDTDLASLDDQGREDWMNAARVTGLIGIDPWFPPAAVIPPTLLDGLDEADRAEGIALPIAVDVVPAGVPRAAAVLGDPASVEVATKLVPVSFAPTPNHNPEVTGIAFDDAWPAGTSTPITVTLADDAVETYTFGDETRTETLDVRWYVSGGDLTGSRVEPADTVVWSDIPEHATVWAVVADGRGGMGWTSVSR
jgi:hypothetical protein